MLLAIALFLSVTCGREGGSGRYRVVLSCPTGSWYREAMRAVERERYFHPEIDLVILPAHNAGQQM